MDKRFHCQHCNEKISNTLYYQHKRRYYSNTWQEDDQFSKLEGPESCRLEEDFVFSDHEQDFHITGTYIISLVCIACRVHFSHKIIISYNYVPPDNVIRVHFSHKIIISYNYVPHDNVIRL